MKFIHFHGSHGTVTVNPISGRVLEISDDECGVPACPGYRDYEFADLEEWRDWHRRTGNVLTPDDDVLNVGWFNSINGYEPAEPLHRRIHEIGDEAAFAEFDAREKLAPSPEYDPRAEKE